MAQTDATRIQVQEGAYTFLNKILAYVLLEIDRNTSGANTYMTLSRSGGLITNASYYSNFAKTLKVFEHQYGYSSSRITSVTSIYYNADGVTEDSRVTHSIGRLTGDIVNEASPFTTTKATKI